MPTLRILMRRGGIAKLSRRNRNWNKLSAELLNISHAPADAMTLASQRWRAKPVIKHSRPARFKRTHDSPTGFHLDGSQSCVQPLWGNSKKYVAGGNFGVRECACKCAAQA